MNSVQSASLAAGAALKTAFYAAHYLYARRVSGPYVRPGEPPLASGARPPDIASLRRSFVDAFAQDRACIAQGLYPAPDPGAELRKMAASPAYARDLKVLDSRRMANRPAEVRELPASDGFPAYYRQNFHWQTDGWLSDESAALYDFQVETIFTGAAGAMRRATALALLAEALAGRDQRHLAHCDLACGTGDFAAQTARAWPRLSITALDMSPHYAARASRALRHWPWARAVTGMAEALPFADASLDTATCVYLFHELPPKVRVLAAREIARVIKPGGVFILADALQRGDNADLDPLLEAFPRGFHEPYFLSWLDLDAVELFASAGFEMVGQRQAFLTKATAFRRRDNGAGIKPSARRSAALLRRETQG